MRLADRLLAAGIPVVVVRDERPPTHWSRVEAKDCDISHWRPGVDALAMVSGWGIDVIDVDTKYGGSPDNIQCVRFGKTVTPSLGYHFPVRSTGLGSIHNLYTASGFVGDYAGGREDGSGRMLIYLPESTRKKYPGAHYVEMEEWQIEEVLASYRDPQLIEHIKFSAAERGPVYVDESPLRPKSEGIHPYAARVVELELSRLDTCQIVGWGTYWDSTTFAVACNLIELANSPWSGYSIASAQRDLSARAPEDEGFGKRQHREKWTSALSKVGRGSRRNPEDLPIEWLSTPHPIWDSTDVLAHIRQAAHSRYIGSGVLLCYVLGRVLAEVPPDVVLPPVVGSEASLNLGFAIVGKSGDGKSSAAAVASELLGIDQGPLEIGLGSGEGVIESFMETVEVPDPTDPSRRVRVRRVVSPPSKILEIDEVGHLGAVGKRDGSSMLPILRSALTGGSLRSSNATAERNRAVPRGAYRLVVFAGVQPELSGILLDDAASGTPQRFLWVSAVDRTLPDEPPAWPGELKWDTAHIEFLGATRVRYPQNIKDEILKARALQVREGRDPLRGHHLLTQLKVASALALLHRETEITDQWWSIAAHMMRWSDKEQERCRKAMQGAADRQAVARGTQEAKVEHARLRARIVSVENRMVDALRAGPLSWNALRNSLDSVLRDSAEEALDRLRLAGRVSVEAAKQGGRKITLIR